LLAFFTSKIAKRQTTKSRSRQWCATREVKTMEPLKRLLAIYLISNTVVLALSQAYITKQASFSLAKTNSALSPKRRWTRLWRKQQKSSETQELDFQYDYDQLQIGKSVAFQKNATGVVLVHPIGVGIGKWFFNRLLDALSTRHGDTTKSLVLVVPDLLGSGSACNPTLRNNGAHELKRLPLLNISDWSDQVVHLMAGVEQEHPEIDNWCIVANGGCSPIALQVAQRFIEGTSPSQQVVSTVVLSSLPRLSFFLTSSDPQKVAKSYRTLCSVVGRLFWWYSCRNEGQFIQKFSEKNLVADPANLGEEWRPNCVQTARMHGGKSRYSTFAFLAGTLQDGCRNSLAALKDSGVMIGIIKGRDVRRNQAKSWFWQRSKGRKRQKSSASSTDSDSTVPRETFGDYVKNNGNGGQEIEVGGRISLAHEDAPGYSDALIDLVG
jgi:hypothetical protein